MKDYKVTVFTSSMFSGLDFFTKAHNLQDAMSRVETEWNRKNSATLIGINVLVLEAGAIL